MKKLAVICSTDYNTYPVGGMMSFIKDVAPALAKRFDVDFWGVDAGAGCSSFMAGGHEFPVRYFGSVQIGRKMVPNVIRVTWQLWRNRKQLLQQDYDGVYIHGIPLNLALSRNAPCIRKGLINHVHGLTNPFLMHGVPNALMVAAAKIYDKYRRSVVARSRLVLLAADHKGIEQFRLAHPNAARIAKLENFCDASLFNSDVVPADRQDHGVSACARVIVHVGRFAYQKDPLLALQIFARFLQSGRAANEVLVMIGDGPLLKDGRALAAALGVAPRVIFLGHQPREAIARWLAAADLYLYTSHANGYPISLSEAAQSGLPIVSTAVTGVHDLVVDGENGHLAPDRNPESFIALIADALEKRKAFGERSRQLAAQHTPDIILERLCQEISDVL